MKQLLLTTITLIALLCSCSLATTHISDCTFDSYKMAYKDGKLFDGTIISDDGKFAKIVVKNGVVEQILCYHKNGKLAWKKDINNHESNYYDEDGCILTSPDFSDKYPDIMMKKRGIHKQMHSLSVD